MLGASHMRSRTNYLQQCEGETDICSKFKRKGSVHNGQNSKNQVTHEILELLYKNFDSPFSPPENITIYSCCQNLMW